MVCKQAEKFNEARLCCKPKAEFRACLTQSGAKLTLGLVDIHSNERGVKMRGNVLAYGRAHVCARVHDCMYERHNARR